MYNDYLMHHGVKGMKWGVRKKRISNSRKKQMLKMSNKDLQDAINRKNLEKQYLKQTISKGNAKTKKILATVGGIATAAVSGALIATGKDFLTGFISGAVEEAWSLRK